MIEESPDRLRMLGSLRTTKQCIECHSVRRGELLGALTYELVPEKLEPKGPKSAAPEI